MKTVKLLAIGIILLATQASKAQIAVNLNIGTPPAWGPAGYSNVDYYYLPDVEAYYDIRDSQFIYYGNGSWVRSRYLPRQYRNYDLYNGYKVVLNNYHGHSPYSNFQNHRRDYRVGYRRGYQKTVGHRHIEQRYVQRPTYSRNHKYDDNRRYSENRRNNNNDNRGRNESHGNKGHHKD